MGPKKFFFPPPPTPLDQQIPARTTRGGGQDRISQIIQQVFLSPPPTCV